MTNDDFEMQADFFDHYMTAPISGYATTVSERCSAVLPDGLKDKCRKSFEADFTPEKATEAVPWLAAATEELAEMYFAEIKEKVKPAFAKFDKDGSGAIDLQEFKAMTAELGQQLDDDQVEVAVTDLDVNGDGLIDLDEFASWYFSGMKDYSSNRRSFLKFKKGLATFAGTLGEAGAMFKEDPRTITHHQRLSFNKPADPQCVVEAKYTIVGPKHDELMAEAKKFQAERDLNTEGNICFFASAVISSSDEAWAAAEPIYKVLMEEEEIKSDLARRAGHVDVQYASGKITMRYMEYFDPAGGDFSPFYLPQDLVEALKTVDTSVSVRAELATSPEEILKSEGPMADSALKGFDIEIKAQYMRKMGKVLKNFPPLAEPMQMGGFALGLSSDVTLDLDYSDMDELKEHPMAGQFIELAFNDAFGMIGVPRESIDGYNLELTEAQEAITQDKDHEHFNDCMRAKAAIAGLRIIESLDSGNSAVEFNCVHENLFTGSASVKTPGAGAAGAIAMKLFLMKEDVASALAMIN